MNSTTVAPCGTPHAARSASERRAGVESLDIGAPRDDVRLRARRLGHDAGDGREESGGIAAQALAVAVHWPHQEQPVNEALERAGMVDDRRIDLEDRRDPELFRSADALPAKVVVALDERIGLRLPRDRGHRVARAKAEEALLRRPRHAVPGDAAQRLGRALRSDDHVHVMPAGREAACHLPHVDAATGGAGDVLVGDHVQNLHCPLAAPGRCSRRAKKGPVRTRAKKTTSSFISHVSAAATAMTKGDGGGPPARRAAGSGADSWACPVSP